MGRYSWKDVTVVELTKEAIAAKLSEFEKRFGMSSKYFYVKFNHGELGDDVEFVRWASYYDMAAKARISKPATKV